jgi:glucose-1-phosphate thymidylyltransferase
MEAAQFVATLEHRQGFKIACPEEVAYRLGFTDAQDLQASALRYGKSTYGQYLQKLLLSVLEDPDAIAVYRPRMAAATPAAWML